MRSADNAARESRIDGPPPARLKLFRIAGRLLLGGIAAICSTPFRSAPAAAAPYLAENVAVMTKMMIDMQPMRRPGGEYSPAP
jgi:hypothetical protein